MKLGQHIRAGPEDDPINGNPPDGSLAELEERIEQELESNPTLELSDGDSDDAGVQAQIAEERRERQTGRPAPRVRRHLRRRGL